MRKLYFLNSDTQAKNIFGYYTYETGNPTKSIEDIEKSTVIAFPNAKVIVKGENRTTYKGALMQVKLSNFAISKMVRIKERHSLLEFLLDLYYIMMDIKQTMVH